jgi:hypothetical protein
MKGMKIHIIILACVLTLAAALLGQRFFYQQRVADPLQASLSAVPGVEKATVQNNNGKRVIDLQLQDNANLWSVYSTVNQLGQQNLGATFAGVVVKDNRDNALTDSFYRMHFHVQQAIATGLFTNMAAGIDAIAQQDKLSDHKVFVDEANVYIQLKNGDHHLYEVIARPQKILQPQQTAGGGTAI